MINEIRYRTKIDRNNMQDILKKILIRMDKIQCSFLEIGCDIGQTYDIIMNNYKDVKYYGIDYNEEAIKYACEKYRTHDCKFVTMDAKKMCFSEQQFDVVFARMIFEDYVRLEKEILNEIVRVIKPGGLLCLHFINSMVPFVSPHIPISAKFRRGCKILEDMNDPLFVQAYRHLLELNIESEIEFLQRDTLNPGREWLKEYYFSDRIPFEADNLVKLNLMSLQELKEHNKEMRKIIDDKSNYVCFMQVLLWAYRSG